MSWSSARVELDASSRSVRDAEVDLLILPMFEGPSPGPRVREAGTAMGADLVTMFAAEGLTGRPEDSLETASVGQLRARNLLLVGVGAQGEAGADAVREAAARAAETAARHRTVATTLAQLGSDARASAVALTEGLLLGAHRLDRYKYEPVDDASKRPPELETVEALTTHSHVEPTRNGLHRGTVSAGVTNWARDLVNTPAQDATPASLASEARAMATREGLECRVWSRAELARGGFGGILGVGRGASNEPRMVELTYRCASAREKPVAITGKGITFDSGGLDLKNDGEMEWMKSDMAGAAAALATIRAAAELDLHVNVDVVVAFAENMPGANATRPGDVLMHRGGTTSEVLDTDAEGRVLLADVLAYLSEREPAAILDSATLTDGSGLGPDLWAVMGSDRALAAELVSSGAEAGEPGWGIPLWQPYLRYITDSSVADVKNVGDHYIDSAMMAGLFLQRFVGGVPWAHLDTASSAWAEHDTDLWPSGATGSPARTFIRFLERRAK